LETNDAELVRRCRSGDRDAWEVIVRQHHQRIYNLAYRFTGRFDEAEDLTQEIFLKVYRILGSYQTGAASFGTWMARVARNHLIDHYRKYKAERTRTDPLEEQYDRAIEYASRADNPGQIFERQETSAQIHRLLLQLPEDQREAVILRDLEEFTYEEIAVMLGVPVGTVKSRINRGRIELARLLREKS
jgi:RNA polymerase sigma-70 factor (ECF subfamily)